MAPPAIRLCPPDQIQILDQTRLPSETAVVRLRDVEGVREAIATLRIRGAPLLGLAGAAGLALAASTHAAEAELRSAADILANARPTAVDLGMRVEEALALALPFPEGERATALWRHAEQLLKARQAEDEAIGTAGALLISAGSSVLTHCNTGELATGGKGTAFAVVREAWESGRLSRCYVTETRPLLQGARLTAWELRQNGIPATLLPDTAAGSLLARGLVGAVITGADRVAANGDTANKIGTYQLAVLANRHQVPFYIAAPTSTVDLRCERGSSIPIEVRAADEVGGYGGLRWSPDGIEAYNPAFDVTPAELIQAIVTEKGIVRPPYRAGLAAVCGER